MEQHEEFFRRRAREERRAAARDPDREEAQTHLRLADQYEALAASYAMIEHETGLPQRTTQ